MARAIWKDGKTYARRNRKWMEIGGAAPSAGGVPAGPATTGPTQPLGSAAAQRVAGYLKSIHDGWRTYDRSSALSYAAPLARIEAGLPAPPGLDEPQVLERADPLHTAGVAILARGWP